MKFGSVRLSEAAGAVLAHSVATPSGTLRKGTVLDAGSIARIAEAGVEAVVAARLEPGDVAEDEAARRVAVALAGPGVSVEPPATGRCNLFAAAAGLLVLDPATVDAVNRIDPAITLATLPPMRGVEAGRMIATVKVIPFAVDEETVARAVAAAGGGSLRVQPYRPLRVAAVSTLLPSLKPSVVEKTLAALARRLAPAGATIAADHRVPHAIQPLAAVLAEAARTDDLIIVFGASAVVDAADVVPSAIEAAGGEVIHFGMPVDPGNLLVLGRIGPVPVVGAPGCARSPRENGFDIVLEQLLAGRIPTAAEITGLGVGGLMMDIVTRPAPRTGEARREDPDAPRIAGIVLAAGLSSRFAGNKLLAKVGGEALVRRAARASIEAGMAETLVVTGHARDEVEAALAGLPVRFVHNPDFATGQASSLKTGIAAVPDDCEAALVLLGDMPGVDAATVRLVAGAYRPGAGNLVVVPVHGGRRGNPVLWSRRTFADLMAIEGDRGARDLIGRDPDAMVTVEAGPGVLIDVDTREALEQATFPAAPEGPKA